MNDELILICVECSVCLLGTYFVVLLANRNRTSKGDAWRRFTTNATFCSSGSTATCSRSTRRASRKRACKNSVRGADFCAFDSPAELDLLQVHAEAAVAAARHVRHQTRRIRVDSQGASACLLCSVLISNEFADGHGHKSQALLLMSAGISSLCCAARGGAPTFRLQRRRFVALCC